MSRGKRQNEEELDEDEVYQYPKAGSGPVFAAIENILRCAICREVSEPPVSLPCCQQVFCSLCIRLYLDTTKPRCPICRGDAAQNQLVVSKELRSVCSLWKQNRRAIVSAARATVSHEVGSMILEGIPELRRSPGATPRQRRDGGRLKAVYYHSTKDGKMREILRSLGLPIDGDKATMVARHKRLVLLDAASNDREMPLPRSELVRQVLSWEREKGREKAAERATASRSLLSRSSSMSSPAFPERVGQAQTGASEGRESAQPMEIPKSMQNGFKALIASAKEAARKRKATYTSTATTTDPDGSVSKKPRPSQESDNTSSGCAANSDAASCSSGAVVECGSLTSPSSAKPPGSSFPPLRVDGWVGDGDGSMAIPATGTRTNVEIAVGSGAGASDDTPETRILGVAGRMVRTRGPWRCVFSTGKQASKGHRSLGAAGASLSKASEVGPGCVDLVNGDRVDVGIGKKEGEVISALSTPSGGAVKNDHNEGTTRNDRDPAVKRGALSGKIDPELDETSHGAGGEDPESNEADGGGADLPLEGEVGLIYLNPTTGETALEPPPELVARAEEAEVAGEYLIFIPSRGFFVAAKHAQPVTAAASCATPSMTIEASRKEGVFEGTDADKGGVLRAGQGRALATPDPRGSAGPLETDGGGGTDAWDRLSVTSQQGTPLSQTPGVRGTGARSATVTRDFEQRGPTKTSNPETSVASLTIDLSQGGSRKLSPMIVAEKDIEGEGVGADEAGGFAETGGVERTGTEEARGTWACAVCTLENKERARRCAVCETPKAKPSGSKSGSRLRLPSRRNNGDKAPPQSTITSFAARPPGAICNSGRIGDEIPVARARSAVDGVVEVTAASTLLTPTASRAGFPAVRSSERSSARSEEQPPAKT